MRVVILNWTGERANWGCQATSQGLLQDLLEAVGPGREAHIDTVPLEDVRPAEKRVAAVFGRFLWQYLGESNPSPTSRMLFQGICTRLYGPYVQTIEQADVVVFMAEGTMTGKDFFGGSRLLMLPCLATELGKPVLSLNQTIYSAVPDFLPRVQNVYQRFGLVAVREQASLRYAREIGLDQAVLFPDSAFRSEPSRRRVEDLLSGGLQRPYLCVTGAASFSDKTVLPYIRTTLEFARTHDLQVCSLLWTKGLTAEIRAIHNQVGGHPLLTPAPGIDYRDVSEILSKAVGYVGGRYHTAIQAAAVHTPFVALPTESHKMEGLIEMLGYPLEVRRFEDTEAIRGDLTNILDDREGLSKSLGDGMARVTELREAGVELLRRMIDQTGYD